MLRVALAMLLVTSGAALDAMAYEGIQQHFLEKQGQRQSNRAYQDAVALCKKGGNNVNKAMKVLAMNYRPDGEAASEELHRSLLQACFVDVGLIGEGESCKL